MKRTSFAPFVATLSLLFAVAGCSHPKAERLNTMQLRELQSFGREMWANFGDRQPPVDTWAGALPWLKFKRLELRADGAYFIMNESDTEESGYAVVDNVGEFMKQHPGPDNSILDNFVCQYRFKK